MNENAYKREAEFEFFVWKELSLSPEKDSEYPGSREEAVVVNNFAHFLTEQDTHNMTDFAHYGSHFRDSLYRVLNLPNVPTSLEAEAALFYP